MAGSSNRESQERKPPSKTPSRSPFFSSVGLILANRQERRALKALRERCPELPTPISGVMAVLIALLGVLALISAILR
jgi:hypothetical protein